MLETILIYTFLVAVAATVATLALLMLLMLAYLVALGVILLIELRSYLRNPQ
jgi:high-affinity Fe2+/Pb2+ permease